MVNSNKIKELITSAHNIVITSHKNVDLDAIGSILGIYYTAKNYSKDMYIVLNDEKYEPEVRRTLSTIKKEDHIITNTYQEIKKNINDKTLLIIVDTNKKNRIQNVELLNIKDKILIDHHIKTDSSVDDAIYEYVDNNESSTAEIVMDLINDLNVYIPSYIATIMLAGIYVDTNGFILKTNENTHLCASLLYKFGADNKEAEHLLKQNYNEYKRRQKLIMKTEFYDDIAITTGRNMIYDTAELAKSSDVLLTFNNVEASYTIARIDKDTIGISARSLGNKDVETVMKHFNGGGHKTDAATQINGRDVNIIKEELLKYLRGI